ncbi:heterokaryon incompatibility protein-domain-containing protein [Xylaria scruposa]|nr:heterokaryon incompatibility protein-domain-containing protein [Xylaria scruposa]
MASLSSDYHCNCTSLVTVAALCKDEPIVIAPHVALLKESANRQDACPFCALCWTALEQAFGRSAENWAASSGSRAVSVTGDFKFLTAVRTTDGRLLEGLVKKRCPDTSVPRVYLRDSPDCGIGIFIHEVSVLAATLKVFALPETKGASHIKERCSSIDSDPDQKAIRELMNEWLHECSTHELCASVEEEMEMPTRVIDVTSRENPLLVITAGKRGKFLALSYCWGPQGEDLFLLTNETQSALLHGSVKESVFARTHREVFAIARSLGIQYVWIDALCIIQKNKKDWEAESKKMRQVYNNAYLTVLAGSSVDCRAGFLSDRPSPVQPFPIPLDDPCDGQQPFLFATLTRSHAEGPTRTRSWCFQESMLSRRLLIFGTEQLRFRCITGERSEHAPLIQMDGVRRTLDDHETPFFNPELQQLRAYPGDAGVVRSSVLEHWYVTLIEFTHRRFSNPHDVFAGISSIAQAAAPHLGGSRYLAGLWERDLIRGLLWRPAAFGSELGEPGVLTRPVERAPTWSWASVEGGIDHLDYEPNWEVPIIENQSPFKSGAVPGGEQIRKSVFDTKTDFVRVRPAARSSQAEQDDHDDAWCWSDDTHFKPDTVHIEAPNLPQLLMWGRLVKAVFSDQCVNVKRWRPRHDWRPQEQRRETYERMFNGRRPVFERALMIYGYGFYLLDSEEQGKTFAVGLFDVKEETCREVWCLQLTEVEGLMLREVESHDGIRRFQRLGLFWLEEKDWFADIDEVLVRLK